MTYLVLLGFMAILGSLAAALFFMMRGSTTGDAQRTQKMATSLAMRVGFSILLFVAILAAWALGWIQPTGRI